MIELQNYLEGTVRYLEVHKKTRILVEGERARKI